MPFIKTSCIDFAYQIMDPNITSDLMLNDMWHGWSKYQYLWVRNCPCHHLFSVVLNWCPLICVLFCVQLTRVFVLAADACVCLWRLWPGRDWVSGLCQSSPDSPGTWQGYQRHLWAEKGEYAYMVGHKIRTGQYVSFLTHISGC